MAVDDCAGFAVDCVGFAVDDDCGAAAGFAVEAPLAVEAGAAAPAVAAAAGTVARTSCSVMIRGGADVMKVALS